MQRVMPWLSAAFLGIAIYLGVAVWRQRSEKAQWQQESTMRASQVAALRPRTLAPRAIMRSSQTDESQATPARNLNQASPAVVDPKAIEAAREDDLKVANGEKRSFRRNALHSYISGFDALQLAPEKSAQAKEIILAGWQAAANGRKTARSAEDAAAASARGIQAMDDQMTALLGQNDYDVLQASTREGTLDWTIGTDMWDGGAPLEPDQLHAIALAQIRIKFGPANWSTAPNEAQTPDPQTRLSSQDTALLTATAPFLSPAQQEIFRKSLIEENLYNAAMRAFSEKQAQIWRANGLSHR
jgi:hypothetical protein